MNKITLNVTSPEGKALYEIALPLSVDDEGGFWPSGENSKNELETLFKTVDEVIVGWIETANPFGSIRTHLMKTSGLADREMPDDGP